MLHHLNWNPPSKFWADTKIFLKQKRKKSKLKSRLKDLKENLKDNFSKVALVVFWIGFCFILEVSFKVQPRTSYSSPWWPRSWLPLRRDLVSKIHNKFSGAEWTYWLFQKWRDSISRCRNQSHPWWHAPKLWRWLYGQAILYWYWLFSTVGILWRHACNTMLSESLASCCYADWEMDRTNKCCSVCTRRASIFRHGCNLIDGRVLARD